MIDLSTVKILNSPDIHAWPATTAITKLELQPSGVHVEFTKQDDAGRWPDVPFGDPAAHGTLQYTLWIVLRVAGEWLAAGCIEFWFGLRESGGPVTEYAKNWYYDPNRWPGMAGHQPAPGEQVGFLVTSGDARHGDDGVGLHERSNIVAVTFPAASGGVFTFDNSEPAPASVPAPAQPTAPTPAQTPAPHSAPVPADAGHEALLQLFETFERLTSHIEDLAAAVLSMDAKIERLQHDGVRIRL